MTAQVALFPQAASTTAQAVDQLVWFLLIVCGSVGGMVAVLLIYFAVRYRLRPGQQLPPPETASSHVLEWMWILIPLPIFGGMFLWGSQVYFAAYRAPDDATPVYAVAKQWMWKFQHPEGQREINMLHVPIGRPVKVLLTSEDVIHSFFVPEFRVHMDVLPERYTSVWFQAIRPGTYHLFCSQYCGTSHAGMIGTVVAMEPADYDDWLHLRAEGSLALEGRKLFLEYRCVSCHSADEEARAPVLEQLFGRRVHLRDGQTVVADENYLRTSLVQPSLQIVAGFEDLMPTFKGQLDEEKIIALIAFIKALRSGETPRRVEDYPPPATTPPIEPKDSAP